MSRTRTPSLPADVEFVRGDLTAADTLDACVDGIDSVCLVSTAPLAAAAPAIERIAGSLSIAATGGRRRSTAATSQTHREIGRSAR